MAIRLLDNSMINKIAAGEVVERPASVVKELVENSIDAGSTTIVVEISDGGTSLIKITDNGCGIKSDEVKTAFLRHATSKIYNLNDLENVLTMGFRGEALSSIASVSQVELVTKTCESVSGICVQINGGEVVSEHEVGVANGTSITVRNLFYNTPARKKFMKKPSAESAYVSDVLLRLALGNPSISFRYINNGSTVMQTKGKGGLEQVIFQVYGKDIHSNLLPVMHEKDGIKLSGFCCKPQMHRGNRSYEQFYINGRYIKSEIVQSAAEAAYKTLLPIGKFPIFVLIMEIEPTLVDVNVHPAKLEVRFFNDDKIYDIVYGAISSALADKNLIPTVTLENKNDNIVENIAGKQFQAKPNVQEFKQEQEVKRISLADFVYGENKTKENEAKAFEEHSEHVYKAEEQSVNYFVAEDTFTNDLSKDKQDKQQEKATSQFFTHYKIVGQLFDTYWIIEQGSSMYVIDQHAAHERIIYEELINSLKKNEKDEGAVSQQVLQPVVLNLTPAEMYTLSENIQLIKEFGFDAEVFGEGLVAIRSLPYVVKGVADISFFIEILDKLSSVQTSITSLHEAKLEAIASVSCKAAVKANDKLSYAEARALIERLLKLENPFTCPHGRPTVIEITEYELEKKFKRIQ